MTKDEQAQCPQPYKALTERQVVHFVSDLPRIIFSGAEDRVDYYFADVMITLQKSLVAYPQILDLKDTPPGCGIIQTFFLGIGEPSCGRAETWKLYWVSIIAGGQKCDDHGDQWNYVKSLHWHSVATSGIILTANFTFVSGVLKREYQSSDWTVYGSTPCRDASKNHLTGTTNDCLAELSAGEYADLVLRVADTIKMNMLRDTLKRDFEKSQLAYAYRHPGNS